MDNTMLACYTVFDLFQKGSQNKIIIRPNGQDFRLEKYEFQKYQNGDILFVYQVGWYAGSHYDGGYSRNTIPEEWLRLSWNEFLDNFCKRFPPYECYYSRDDLAQMNKLRTFLGF